MADKPVVGDIWILGNMPEDSLISVNQVDTLASKFELWEELNGQLARITGIDKGSLSLTIYEFELADDPSIYGGVTGDYFVKPFTIAPIAPKFYKCCKPSVALCEACKTEFKAEMISKGKTFNTYLKIWQ